MNLVGFFFLLYPGKFMTRIKEPELGIHTIPDYKSPPSRIVKSLRKAYDNARERITEKSKQISALKGKLRDVKESRESWKTLQKDSELELERLKAENERLQQELKKRRGSI